MANTTSQNAKKLPMGAGHGPLIIATPEEAISSVATKVVLAQKTATETGIHVLLTSAYQCGKLYANNSLCNKLIVLAYNIKADQEYRHKFTGGYWCTTKISSDTVLLSLHIEQDMVLSRSSVENILATIHPHSSQKQVKTEIPSLDQFVAELNAGRGESYLNEVRRNITEVIDLLSESGKTQRLTINRVACVLSFFKDRLELLNALSNYLNLKLLHLVSPSDSVKSKSIFRVIDSLLYLIYELTDKHSIPALATNISAAISALIEREVQPVMFSRALRQSFLKGCDLVQYLPSVVHLMEVTETDDAAGFLIILKLLGANEKENSAKCANDSYRSIFKISPKGIVLLARDLRRTVPNRTTAPSISSDEAITWINQCDDSKPDRQTSLAKCLMLHYINCFGPQLIIWLKHNYRRLGLEDSDVSTLSALAGFDVPFVLDINKALFADGFKIKIKSPSKSQCIADYFNENMASWKATPYNISAHSDITDPPLVTVIFTTYNPNIKLFSLSLESILRQTYRAVEVIIIDDHSPVESSLSLKALIENLRHNYPHSIIYERNETNVGQYLSRNKAIGMAKGSFIAIQDDDDISHPERLQFQIAPMLKNPVIQATHACHIRISENARIMSDGDALGEIMGDAPVSFVWRKQVFEEVGLFLPTKTRGDIEFRTRLRRHYAKDAIFALAHPLVIMRGGLGTVSSDKEYYYRSALSALRYMMAHIPSGTADSEATQRYIPTLLQ